MCPERTGNGAAVRSYPGASTRFSGLDDRGVIGMNQQPPPEQGEIERLRARLHALETHLAEKETLLREVHHRVKNNLAAIVGLLDMQRRLLTDPRARDGLESLGRRIRSMGLVHEKIYAAENFTRIDFQGYLEALVAHLAPSLDAVNIEVHIEAQGVHLPLDLAMPCGLITNELVGNAFLHAFPGRVPAAGEQACRVLVCASTHGGQYQLSVSDNGCGLPSAFDWTQAQSMGMVLIRMLGCHQLGGSYTFDHNRGLSVPLRFHEQRGG
jgi:two-component sensor histidine kinase